MKKIVFAAAAVFAAVTAPLGAQFQSMVVPNNGGTPFWDNRSTDGPATGTNVCNIGFILTKAAGSGSCINQRPDPWLPYSGTVPSAYWGTASGAWAGFLITPGVYNLSLVGGTGTNLFGGDVAGANQDWGWFTLSSGGVRTPTSLNALPLNGSAVAINTGSLLWGLWINLYDGGTAYSDLNPQFAAFAAGSHSVVFGLEDTKNGDHDYQDEIFKISWDGQGRITETVPEPMTMTLLATGLVGLAGVSRRRSKK